MLNAPVVVFAIVILGNVLALMDTKERAANEHRVRTIAPDMELANLLKIWHMLQHGAITQTDISA
jgi:hypothetical protein